MWTFGSNEQTVWKDSNGNYNKKSERIVENLIQVCNQRYSDVIKVCDAMVDFLIDTVDYKGLYFEIEPIVNVGDRQGGFYIRFKPTDSCTHWHHSCHIYNKYLTLDNIRF